MHAYESWWEEKRSAYLYQIMAECEKNPVHKKLFLSLQEAAEKQATLWEKTLTDTKTTVPLVFTPDKRTHLVTWLIQWLGAKNIYFILSAMKIRGMSVFTHFRLEHRHINFNAASNLRAAVFGVNDGLVSNMSLILGFAGAHADYHSIIIAGVAGLLAGACSMGAGEYISMRSQREVFERQIEMEKEELALYPEEEIAELSLIYQARNIPKEEADKLARLLINNPETALNTLVREELNLNPNELGSPWGATMFSFLAFGIGAAIPLLPFLLHTQAHHLTTSITLTAVALFTIGAILSLFTNRPPLLLGLRMLCIGTLAGALTYGIGHALGVILS